MSRTKQLNLVISKVKKDMAIDKIKLVSISSLIETGERELVKYEAELAELNKAKTGRVKIGGVVNCDLFLVRATGEVYPIFKKEINAEVCLRDIELYISQGRLFYDRASAELFALREKTEFKIWCEFNHRFVVVQPTLSLCWGTIHLGVRYYGVGDHEDFNNFLDTLSEDELNSIRS